MKNKEKKYILYYISGIILAIVSILGIIVGISFGYIVSEYKYSGYIGVGLTILFLLLSFYSIYLLKKANYLKLNKDLNKSKDDFIKKLKSKNNKEK